MQWYAGEQETEEEMENGHKKALSLPFLSCREQPWKEECLVTDTWSCVYLFIVHPLHILSFILFPNLIVIKFIPEDCSGHNPTLLADRQKIFLFYFRSMKVCFIIGLVVFPLSLFWGIWPVMLNKTTLILTLSLRWTLKQQPRLFVGIALCAGQHKARARLLWIMQINHILIL